MSLYLGFKRPFDVAGYIALGFSYCDGVTKNIVDITQYAMSGSEVTLVLNGLDKLKYFRGFYIGYRSTADVWINVCLQSLSNIFKRFRS